MLVFSAEHLVPHTFAAYATPPGVEPIQEK